MIHTITWMDLTVIRLSEKCQSQKVAYLIIPTLVIKNPSANAGNIRNNPWVEKIPWRRAWQPSPVFLPGESHGQRSLAGYSL